MFNIEEKSVFKQQEDLTERRYIALSAVVAAAIFALDLLMPLGVAGGVPYVALVLLALWAPRQRYIIIMAALSCALTGLGFFLSAPGSKLWIVIVNRLLAMFAILVTAIAAWYFKTERLALRKAREDLQRTNEELIDHQRELEQSNEDLATQIKKRAVVGKELLALNEELKTFAYIVSHDLRAPLLNIKGFAGELNMSIETLNEKISGILPGLDEELRLDITDIILKDVPESLRFIDTSTSRMDHLLQAILKLSRLGRKELKMKQVNMAGIVQSVLDSLSYQIEEKEVKITVGPLPDAIADKVSMEQVWGNILSNAVNYLDPDRPGRIEISGMSTGEEAFFKVVDNGRGIAENDTHKVFEIFRRAGKNDVPGEGMGMAYVQTIVRSHGGHIWFDSEPGAGSTFYFAVPVLPLKEQEDG